MSGRGIIGLCGAARCGKSTAADYLTKRHLFVRIKLAGALKDMLRAIGLTERHIEGDLKEAPCDLLGGKTPRFAMQTLGTEWGRQIICDDLWVRVWRGAVDSVPHWRMIVTDDVRFDNEAAAVRAAGGIIVRLTRASSGIAGGHVSEANAVEADIVIANDGTTQELYDAIDRVVYGLLEEKLTA